MTAPSLESLLKQLEQCRNRFGSGEARRVVRLLSALDKRQFPDPQSLIRYHEAVLFLRAFPQGPDVARKCDSLLDSFAERTEELQSAGADMDDFDPLEVSGISGTAMQDTLSFDVAQWLVELIPDAEIVWDEFAEDRALGAIWPRLMPLLEEDGDIEPNIPWQRWLQAATGSKDRNLLWLVRRFAELPAPDTQKALLYDSLRIPVRWRLGNHRFSRTRNRMPVRNLFFHREPLIARGDVSLAREFARDPPKLRRLSVKEGERVVNMARQVMMVRYRELYGMTFGDPRSVARSDVGRGVSIYLWNLHPARRLPLRAYCAGFVLKNGVVVSYFETTGLCEWMEVGFNVFYTFRGGEVAWVYAQVLRCLVELTGARCISMYPYQLGDGNDEAIESGAFWFYRKLGFRPGRKDLLKLVEREEERIGRDPKYRTPVRTLRRLAAGHVFYELPGSEGGVWDRFSTRTIGMKVNELMAGKFGGNSERIRSASAKWLARELNTQPPRNSLERSNFEELSLVLALPPSDVTAWNAQQKKALLEIIRAKSAGNEMRYLRLTQSHRALREIVLKLGSS